MIFILNIAFLTILGFISIEDLKTMEISDRWHLAIVILGILNILTGGIPFYSSIGGLFAVSIPLLLLAVLCPGSIGGGDIKMVGASGFLLGYDKILIGSGTGFLLGGIYGIYLLLSGKKNAREHFPFGPWLAVGIGTASFMS